MTILFLFVGMIIGVVIGMSIMAAIVMSRTAELTEAELKAWQEHIRRDNNGSKQ